MAWIERSADVLGDTASFRELLLPQHIFTAISSMGFERPSPVQQDAIPLARVGADVVIQAKAGTGKTLVFAVTAVEKVHLADGMPQVLVIAPTREIALQASEVITAVAAELPPPGLSCTSCIGGLPIEEDERCLRRASHVVVGTPGRLAALLQRGSLPTSRLRLLVLDEADKLLGGGTLQADVDTLLGALPAQKQVLALSATFSEESLERVRGLMRRQREVRLCSDDVSLLGIKQLYRTVLPSFSPALLGQPEWRRLFESRADAVLRTLRAVAFHQAVVFCNWRRDAEELTQRLEAAGLPAAYLSAAKGQLERIDALNALRDFRLRVAVTTDLAARGIDLDRVTLVVNLDLPKDAATYAHRVGRAGRFGTRGMAITLVTQKEVEVLGGYLGELGGEISPLPDDTPPRSCASESEGMKASGEGYPGGAVLGAETPPPSCPSSQTEDATGDPKRGDGGDEHGRAESAELAGLRSAFSDVSTASLWYDQDPSEELPTPLQWPGESPPPPPPAAAAATAAATAAGAAAGEGEGGTASVPHPAPLPAPSPPARQVSLLSGSLKTGGPGAGEGHNPCQEANRAEPAGVPAAHAVPAAPDRQSTSGVRQGATSESLSGNGHARHAAALGPAGRRCSSSDSDSWASSSDDELSSSEDESPIQAGTAPRHVSSPPSSIPRPSTLEVSLQRAQQRRQQHRPSSYHTAYPGGDALSCDGTPLPVVKGVEGRGNSQGGFGAGVSDPDSQVSGRGSKARGSDVQPPPGVHALPEAPVSGAGAQQAQRVAGQQAPHADSRGKRQEEGEEGELEHSFKDSWLTGGQAGMGARPSGQRASSAHDREAREVAFRPGGLAGEQGKAGEVEAGVGGARLRDRPAGQRAEQDGWEEQGAEWTERHSDGERSVVSQYAGSPPRVTSMREPALLAEPPRQEGDGASPGRHYWQVVASAVADLAGPAGEAAADAEQLLQEAFCMVATSAPESAAPAGMEPLREGGGDTPGVRGVAPVSGEEQGEGRGPGGDDRGTTGEEPGGGTCSDALSGVAARQAPAGASLAHTGGGRRRLPLGSAQADAARRQQAQRGVSGPESAAEAEGAGWKGGLAEEAALLEAWAEGEGEEGGVYAEGSDGAEDEGGTASGTANEEAWRQYYVRYYNYYGVYPSHHANPESSPGGRRVSGAARESSIWQGNQIPACEGYQPGHALPHALPPPPPPPPPPPAQATLPTAHHQWPSFAVPQTPKPSPAFPRVPPFTPDEEGYVRIPADMLRSYQEAEWREWRRQYDEWCWVWQQWCAMRYGQGHWQYGPGAELPM